MSEYIKKQDFKDILEEYIDEYDGIDYEGYHNLKWCAMKEALNALEELSTIDITFCKDCGYYGICIDAPNKCFNHQVFTKEDYYCASGITAEEYRQLMITDKKEV